MLFSGYLALICRSSSTMAGWFRGSKGSPPSRVRPLTKAGERSSRILSMTSWVKGWPKLKSQASSLKQPGQRWVQPETKRLTRTPGPLAISRDLMVA